MVSSSSSSSLQKYWQNSAFLLLILLVIVVGAFIFWRRQVAITTTIPATPTATARPKPLDTLVVSGASPLTIQTTSGQSITANQLQSDTLASFTAANGFMLTLDSVTSTVYYRVVTIESGNQDAISTVGIYDTSKSKKPLESILLKPVFTSGTATGLMLSAVGLVTISNQSTLMQGTGFDQQVATAIQQEVLNNIPEFSGTTDGNEIYQSLPYVINILPALK